MANQPRYPIYVPSKGRVDANKTTKCLKEDGIKYYLVVEPQERKIYEEKHGDHADILVLPKNNPGLVYVRNWIKKHSIKNGFERHWQIDDNIIQFERWYKQHRLRCNAGIALSVCEDFTDRYENVAVSGLIYSMFEPCPTVPFIVNAHVYSCTLFCNKTPHEFRGPANEDVDICLQAIAAGLVVIQVKAFMVKKLRTELLKGGCTSLMYDHQDVRLRNARVLEQRWPGVVTVERRFGRPHFKIKDEWKKLKAPLIKKKGLKIKQAPDEYGMKLRAVREPKSPRLRKLLDSA